MISAPEPFAYADVDRLIAEIFGSSFAPAVRQSVAAHAAEHRWLNNEGGGYVGRWRHDFAPYLVEPMEEVNSEHTTVAVAGPGQCAKSAIAENWLHASVDTDPANFLWYMPTKDLLESFVKKRIDTMIESHDTLRAKLGLRAVDDSLSFKRFKGMSCELLVATKSAFISKSAPRIVIDEWDAIDAGLGDIKALADIRRQSYGRESMILGLSHADRAGGMDERKWNDGIMAVYRDSDRRMWWWQCPECGCYSSPNPAASRAMVIDYPDAAPLDEIRDAARLICPVHGCVLEDSRRKEMNLTGRWIGLGQEIAEDGTVDGKLAWRDTAGFWIVGAMSPFILNGIGGLAEARARAQRNLDETGDEKGLKEVIVKGWGLCYDPPRRVGSLDATELADRAEPELERGFVPEGVRFLTASMDIQANRFEWLVRGWGVGGESWVIDVGRRTGDPAASPEDWDSALEFLIDGVWPLADGSGRAMRVRCFAYDTGGGPGVTQQAYAAWRRWRAKPGQKITRHGTVDGRDAWSVIPLKGSGMPNAPHLVVVYPDAQRSDRKAVAAGRVPLGRFNANLFKDDLAGQLAKGDGGGFSIHVPGALRSKEPPHDWFEQLTAETRSKSGAWANTAQKRNEATDLMVMAHVGAHLQGLARMRWTSPPAWAAPWDSNPLVIQHDAAAASSPPPPASPAPASRPAAAGDAKPAAATSWINKRGNWLSRR